MLPFVQIHESYRMAREVDDIFRLHILVPRNRWKLFSLTNVSSLLFDSFRASIFFDIIEKNNRPFSKGKQRGDILM